jgi:hypothetical protein
MVTVARYIDMVPRVALFAVSFPSPVSTLIASCRAYLRPMLYEASVTATAAIIACMAIMMPPQRASNTVNLHKPLAQQATAIKSFRLASHPYIECSLTSATRLAFQPEIPELVAIAAIRQCADRAKHLIELAIPIAGEGGSLAIMDDLNDLLREHARSIVVAIREEADRLAQ